jgi:hypothetical protein
MSSQKKSILVLVTVLAARPGGFSFNADGNGLEVGKMAVKKPRIGLRRDPLTNDPTDFTTGPLKVGQQFICGAHVDYDGKPIVASLLGRVPLEVIKSFPMEAPPQHGEVMVTLEGIIAKPGRYACRIANGDVSETTFFEVK